MIVPYLHSALQSVRQLLQTVALRQLRLQSCVPRHGLQGSCALQITTQLLKTAAQRQLPPHWWTPSPYNPNLCPHGVYITCRY